MANDQLPSFNDVLKSQMTLPTPIKYYGIMILRRIGLVQMRFFRFECHLAPVSNF